MSVIYQVRKLRSNISGRIADYLNTPLLRNGYALILNSGVTSVLGLLFWAIAARGFSPDAVGMNSGSISAMGFLGYAAQLGLGSVLIRFIPTSGRKATGLIIWSYGISIAVSLLLGTIFLLGLDLWTPALSYLRDNPLNAVYFILSIAIWAVFGLQDSALVGLRSATWVAPENILYSIIKIGLLALFAAMAFQYGVFAAWTLPILLLIIPVNLLIFKSLVPKHNQIAPKQLEPVTVRRIVHFVSGEYTSSIIWQATATLMPLIILQVAGPSANAHFFLPWTVSYSLFLISRNMGLSLTAEAANDMSRLERFTYDSLIHTSLFLIPLVLIVLVGAPYILLIFGKGYAAEGATLLRLLALSAIPNIITQLYLSIARVKRQVGSILLALLSLCAIAVGLTLFLLPRIGLVGSGVAWLVGQMVIASILLATRLRPILLVHANWGLLLRIFSGPRNLWLKITNQRDLTRVRNLMPAISSGLAAGPRKPPPLRSWIVKRVVPTVSDMTVAMLGPAVGQAAAVLNLPETEEAAQSFQRQAVVLSTLHQDERLGDFRDLLPHVLAEGRIESRPYWITSLMPGKDSRHLFKDPLLRQNVLRISASGISTLYSATGRRVTVDQPLMERWVYEPIQELLAFENTGHGPDGHADHLERVSKELEDYLAGTRVHVSWIHGDYWPANILVTADGTRLTGIIDWDNATPDDLPCLDLLNLLISARRLLSNAEIGDILVDLLDHPNWTGEEQGLLRLARVCPEEDGVPPRAMLLLYWLRHVRANIRKSKMYQSHSIWLAKNYEAVLNRI